MAQNLKKKQTKKKPKTQCKYSVSDQNGHNPNLTVSGET